MGAKGWFSIPGVQAGERKLKERIAGLSAVREAARGKSVLDLGCAEGLIGSWLLAAGGAASLHGVDKHRPFIETATRLAGDDPRVRFGVADFDDDDWAETAALDASYDIVLALNIAHKLARPALFLKEIVGRAGEMLVLALPSTVIRDVRSGMVPLDVVRELAPSFRLIERFDGYVHPTKGHFGIRLIFRRTAP